MDPALAAGHPSRHQDRLTSACGDMTHVLAAGSRISTGQTGDVSADFEHLRLIDLPGLGAQLIRAGKSHDTGREGRGGSR
jgi:hypothetical protein